MTDTIWQWDACTTAQAIRNKTVSCEEVTQAHVDHMRVTNPGLNAVVVDLGDAAIATAREADVAVAQGGELDLLHGVPITIKENVDVAGRANPNGVVAMKDMLAPSDSPVVRNLTVAGAIPIGLTNTPEFSLRGFTDNPLHGLTLNPWDKAITCGGSSGGAGSALVAGIGALAHGNDIGGSLRWPAHCNGVATIRPTLGRVPVYNESAAAERPISAQLFSVQGPMARSVADVRLGLEVMARRDPRDPWWVPAPLSGSKPNGPLRVALAKVPADMNPDPGVMALIRQAADHLVAEGYQVDEVEMPGLDEIWQCWANPLIGEIRILQQATIRPITSPEFNAVLDDYIAFAEPLDQAGYMATLADRTRHVRNWMALLEDYPIILAPVSVQTAYGATEDVDGPRPIAEMFRNGMRYVGVVNHLGLPSATVPVGLNNGHPVGVQLIATRFREDLALDAAQAIERQAGPLAPQLWSRKT